ncbi:TonB-dependent receptor [Sphingosinicella terrae]|uniref:TonB-dependent receptor n=1 Tax=Sphingosinicella terrae TaxID=2172047 RepID=UPI000E0DC6CA|nr:TonB-dependent receptor [Sphingosinicella terrae]
MGFDCGVRRALFGSAAIVIVASAAPAAAQVKTFNVPAQAAADGIAAFSRQADIQLLISARDAQGRRTNAVMGNFSVAEGLSRLLENSGLQAQATGPQTYTIVPAAPETGRISGMPDEAGPYQEIMVTGTNIRGIIPESSPLTIITRREIDARGATTAEQVVNTLTQNFNSVNANALSADRAGYFNLDAINGVDLRGLGPGTTLVLLNGRRLSGSSGGSVVDISLIPLAAIERVEVLTDSASSVYGSDAVGGVVNFILRERFRGLEATAGYGTTDDGAQDEFRASLTGGLNWSTGNLVLSGNYLDRSSLTTDERDFSRNVAGLYNLSPPERRYGLFLSGRQEAGDRLVFTGNALYNRRTSQFALARDLGEIAGLGYYRTQTTYDQESDSWFGSLGGSYEVSNALTFDVVGSYSRVWNRTDTFETSTLLPPRVNSTRVRAQTYDVTASASGRVLPLPGGDLAYSVGIGATREVLARRTSTTTADRRRSTRYAFGEINLPLIGPQSEINGIHRFEINASARYSDYSDFGEDLSPKVGVLWSVTEGFNLRGSYGRTFRAPGLLSLGQVGAYQIINPVAYGYPNPLGTGTPIGLYIDQGVDSELGPETSNLLALGADLRPPSIPRLAISMTYVAIDYTNRITRGDPGRGTGYFLQPFNYTDLFNFSPTREDFAEILASSELASGNVVGFDQTDLDALVANVGYILDNRLRNIAVSTQKAVDLAVTYAFDRGDIVFSLGANATYILESEARTTPNSPVLSQINILGRPADFRANAFVGLQSGGFSGRLTAYYVDDYANPFTPASPRIGDWVTFDLTASYDFGERRGPLSGVSLLLAVRNLFDTDPPFVADLGPGVTDGLSEPIGHDPTNASPVGRFISLELRKRF